MLPFCADFEEGPLTFVERLPSAEAPPERVFLRQDDDTSRIPGACNFCHDLLIGDERRACSMRYSRRYAADGLVAWLEERGFSVVRTSTARDSHRRPRIAHLLLARR